MSFCSLIHYITVPLTQLQKNTSRRHLSKTNLSSHWHQPHTRVTGGNGVHGVPVPLCHWIWHVLDLEEVTMNRKVENVITVDHHKYGCCTNTGLYLICNETSLSLHVYCKADFITVHTESINTLTMIKHNWTLPSKSYSIILLHFIQVMYHPLSPCISGLIVCLSLGL